MKSSYVIVAMLAITCYRVYHLFFPKESCDLDPPIRLIRKTTTTTTTTLPPSHDHHGETGLDGSSSSTTTDIMNHTWNACDVFSLGYYEARQKFRMAARELGAEEVHLPIVVTKGNKIAEEDEEEKDEEEDYPLTTDIAILHGDLPGFLIHSSGVHGIEGYAGSAIQLALLKKGVLPPRSQRPTIILIHAVNPQGMKDYRRFNENNVDLNRNALPITTDYPGYIQNLWARKAKKEEEGKTMDDNPPSAAALGYEEFRPLLAPNDRSPIPWYDMTIGFWMRAIPALYKYGFIALKRTLVTGQYVDPSGPIFGGFQREKSIEALIEFVTSEQRKILTSTPSSSFSSTKGKVVWIDVHTGLGPLGMDSVKAENEDISLNEMDRWFPTSYHRSTAISEQNTAAFEGYDLTEGFLTTLMYQLSNKTALTMTQEFGTLPGVLVGRAMILENWFYHHISGDRVKDDDQKKLGRQLLQEAFYPQSTRWRSSIVRRGVALVMESIEYMSSMT